MTADSPPSLSELKKIAEYFSAHHRVLEVSPLGQGNINDTFWVRLDHPQADSFVLQRLNTKVFRNPQGVMQNLQCYYQYVSDRLTKSPLTHRWEIPQVMLTREGHNHWQSPDGSFWRAIHYLDKAKTHNILQNANQAEEMGYALGLFHTLISDLPPEQLIDTLEGFHITPNYLVQYQQVLATTPIPSSPDIEYCLRFVSDRADWASVLEDAKAEGKLPLRPIHGDPKVNNVLFDQETHRAIALIDLDTLKPGLIHYDIGDCLRSSCNRLGEETQDWPAVDFDLTLCQGLLKGYLSVAQGFLTPADRDFLFDAMRLLAFELGLRFFGDYLAGNPYFKVNNPDHNLQRALVQFQLTASIEEKEPQIRSLIAKF